MPVLGGGDTALLLRAQRGPSRRTFLASCSSDPPNTLSAGYNAVLRKPLTAEAAAKILEKALAFPTLRQAR